MAKSETEHAVIASFDSSAQANQAANDLMDWEKNSPQVNLGAIGVVTRNARGQIKTKSYAARNTSKGATIGVGVGVLAAVLSGGLTLIPTVIGGAVVGAAAGSLSRKGLGLTEAETQQLSSELNAGCAAVLVTCRDADVKGITDYLVLEGGRVISHPVDPAALEAAAQTTSSATDKGSGGQPPAAG